MLPLVATILALAMLDALNPATIAAQAYLLGTERPLPRSIAFLLATFATYLAGGVLLLIVGDEIAFLLQSWPAWIWIALQVVFGVLALLVGIIAWIAPKAAAAFQPPRSLSVGATVGLAIASTASDVTTALPLFAAIANLTTLQSKLAQVSLLSVYCVIYVAPMLALIGIYTALDPARRQAWFGRITAAVNWTITRLFPPILMLVGMAALIHVAVRIF